MKILKRILLGVLSVVCVGAMAVGFAGCEKECAHEWEGVVVKQATCTENGLRTKVCTLCGDDFSEIIPALGPALGHSYTNYVDDGNTTCTQDGTKTAFCDNGCGEKDVQTVKAHGHNYVNHICEYCDDILASDGLNFTLNEDEKSYSVFKGMFTETQLFIPNTYNGLPVTSIGELAFYNCTGLTRVVIGNSVTSIGNSAFAVCDSLTSIEIPDSVTSIGDWAFYQCTSLTSVVIPDSVTSIGNYAFYECTSLTSIEIPDSVTSIGELAFFFCTSLTSIEIPDSVTSIGNKAFFHCSSLTSVDIPDSVTSIGYGVFYQCSSLTSIEIPDSVTSIGDDAFSYCSSLTSIAFTGTVAQWRAISKGIDWTYNVPAKEVVCKDGTVAV